VFALVNATLTKAQSPARALSDDLCRPDITAPLAPQHAAPFKMKSMRVCRRTRPSGMLRAAPSGDMVLRDSTIRICTDREINAVVKPAAVSMARGSVTRHLSLADDAIRNAGCAMAGAHCDGGRVIGRDKREGER